MVCALISDIHANRQALAAVLTDIRASRADAVICLGDVVGYGPAPAEVLETVYAQVDYILLGNHDAVVGGRMDPSAFNSNARELIEWTARRLDDKAREVLGSLPAVLEGDGFRCVHAEVEMPLRFGYILDAEDALPSWRACAEPLVFVGHTHQPGIFVIGSSGRPHQLEPQDFALEKGKRYIVNVGSVGQPRDGDMRSSYALYDTEAQSVFFRRVPFDIDAYKRDLSDRDVPGKASRFLSIAESATREPVREVLGFRPLSDFEAEKGGEATVERLNQAEIRIRRWRMGGLALALLLLLAVTSAVALYVRFRPRQIDIVGDGYAAAEELLVETVDRAVPMAPPAVGEIRPGTPLAGWLVRVPRSGKVSVTAQAFEMADGAESANGFSIASRSPAPFELRSAPFLVEPEMRFAVQGRFRTRRWEGEGGFVEMGVVYTDPEGAERVVLRKEPFGLRESDEDWPRRSSGTMPKSDALAGHGSVQFFVRGEFEGHLDIADCRLILKGRPD